MKKILLIFLLMAAGIISRSQIAVVNSSVMPYNITPESLLSAAIMNPGMEQQVSLLCRLYNLNNDLLITVRSSLFVLKPGLNAGYNSSRKVFSVEYATGNQAGYIKTSRNLPSGVFKICFEVINVNGNEPNEYCDEIQSDFNQYLYLVYPVDKESISVTSPVLTWSHSEPFNVLSTGEFFRMTVCEIKQNQSPEEAILLNSPVMMKDYLNTHNFQYPYEAKPLERGKRYVWQVTKIGNGNVLNKTEVWEFKIDAGEMKLARVYTSLRKELDASYYSALNNKVFFKFDEEYNKGLISCKIYDSKRVSLEAKATNLLEKKEIANYKQHGLNQYEIDLDDYHISKGFYTLEVRNEKNELFVLKFYVE